MVQSLEKRINKYFDYLDLKGKHYFPQITENLQICNALC